MKGMASLMTALIRETPSFDRRDAVRPVRVGLVPALVLVGEDLVDHAEPHSGLHHAAAQGPIVRFGVEVVGWLHLEEGEPSVIEGGLQDVFALGRREAADLERLAVAVLDRVASVAMLEAMLAGRLQQDLRVLWAYGVVVAQCRDPASADEGERIVVRGSADHVPADALVLRIGTADGAVVEADPWIVESRDDLLRLRRRAVARADHLEVGVGLVQDRGQRSL